MKKSITFLFFLFSLFNINSSSAQWLQMQGPMGGIFLPLNLAAILFLLVQVEVEFFFSSDDANTWTPVNNGLTNLNISCIEINGPSIFVGTYGGGVFLSLDNGNSWNAINNGLTDLTVQSLIASGSSIFAGTTNGLFTSIDNGSSWTLVNIGSANINITSLELLVVQYMLEVLETVYFFQTTLEFLGFR